MEEKYQNKYRIESNRWQLWDYSKPGSYFITICILDRRCILGNVLNHKMVLSECGQIVKNEFLKIPEYHKRIILDEWVVMPNHVHCIISLGDYGYNNGISVIGDDDHPVEKIHEFSLSGATIPTADDLKQYRIRRRKMVIPKIVGKFQMQTSKYINIIRNTQGQKNWQPNYHDHVIRNNLAYQRIKQYIINNPAKWNDDKFYK